MSPGTRYSSLWLDSCRVLDIGHAIEDGKEAPIDTMAMTQGFNSWPYPPKFLSTVEIRERFGSRQSVG